MILMVNGSFRGKDGHTQFYLEKIRETVKDSEIIWIRDIFKDGVANFAEQLKSADALVIGAPLYVDGLPAQVVKLLEDLLAEYKSCFQGLPVYVVSNLGFYEAKQIKHLLDMVRNWCGKMGCIYGGGLAVGAGPLVGAIANVSALKWAYKDVEKGVETLSKTILERESMENYYTETKIPRWLYFKIANQSFENAIKKNGVEAR